MKLHAALEIIKSEIETIQGASPRFFIAVGFLLGVLEKQKSPQDDSIELQFDEINFKPTK